MLLFLAGIQTFHYYSQLPDIVASHFNRAGAANGWSAKKVFFEIYWGGLGLITLIALGVPRLVAWAPAALINLPNKDYWLAPERREEAIAYIGQQLMWFATATLALLIITIEWAIRANLAPEHRISSAAMWVLLAAYGLFVIQWLVRFLGKFVKTD